MMGDIVQFMAQTSARIEDATQKLEKTQKAIQRLENAVERLQRMQVMRSTVQDYPQYPSLGQQGGQPQTEAKPIVMP